MSALGLDDEYDPRRDRIGWLRGAIATLVVALATAIVVAGSALIVGSVEPIGTTSAAAQTTAPPAPTEAAAAAPAPVAAAETTPPPAAAVPPAPTAAPTQATGRAAEGDRSLSFIVSTAELHAGSSVSISISATGPATDRIQKVTVTTADGTELTSGTADGCSGPAYPWSQAFAIAFAQAEATELRVQLRSCSGSVLTATSPVDIQP